MNSLGVKGILCKKVSVTYITGNVLLLLLQCFQHIRGWQISYHTQPSSNTTVFFLLVTFLQYQQAKVHYHSRHLLAL